MRSSALPIILCLLVLGGYPSSYAALRVSHVMIHSSYWTSMEGLDGHHDHAIEAPALLSSLYRPLIALEVALQQRRQP